MAGVRYGPVERVLISVHRWLGIVLALLMTLWAASGIVMLYVAFPELSEAEHYDGLPALNLRDCCAAAAGAALAGAGRVEVAMMADRPVARVAAPDGGADHLAQRRLQRGLRRAHRRGHRDDER